MGKEIIVYGYTKCSTVKKALKFLEDNDFKYNHLDNVECKLVAKEIKEIHVNANVPIKKLFNTSGILYREMNIKDKIKLLTDDECYELLASNGMLVKRPILIFGKKILIGFNQPQWEELLLGVNKWKK